MRQSLNPIELLYLKPTDRTVLSIFRGREHIKYYTNPVDLLVRVRNFEADNSFFFNDVEELDPDKYKHTVGYKEWRRKLLEKYRNKKNYYAVAFSIIAKLNLVMHENGVFGGKDKVADVIFSEEEKVSPDDIVINDEE